VSVTPLLWKVNDLPVHPLLVHLTVVLVPVVCLGALAYLVPAWRDLLRWPLLVGAAIAFVSIWASYLSGSNFQNSVAYFQSGELGRRIDEHRSYAQVFRVVGSVFTLALVGVAGWLHARTGTVRTVAGAVVAALAVVTLVYTVLTGEAGARAVYPPGSFPDAAPAAQR
jgi:uncharacterized membrane protein